MPKLKDYEPLFETVLNYFSKNKGMNTVTAAVAAPAAVAASSSDLLVDLFGAEVANYLADGPAGWIAAGVIVAARVALGIYRRKKA